MSHSVQQTHYQQYNRTFAGSVGSGLQSVFGDDQRRYYVLEHKTTTRYHLRGENQQIIVDQIELGRDAACQVRYDESCPTVSRRHAAIIRDGNNWKIIPLASKNSTYVNGVKIYQDRILQNGDEIQLSTNGPRLGFIIPMGNVGLVKSIRLTDRMSLFRKQALKPYRKAISCVAFILMLCVVAGMIIIARQNGLIKDQGNQIATSKELIMRQEKAIADARKQTDSIALAAKRELAALKKVVNVPSMIEPFKNDVYYIYGEIRYNGKVLNVPEINRSGQPVDRNGNPVRSFDDAVWKPCAWSGTAFLLDDGRLVTARHCVAPWRFNNSAAQLIVPDSRLEAVITAYSKDGDIIRFTSSDCVMDNSDDTAISSNGETIFVYTYGRENDWAYLQTDKKSAHLKAASRGTVVNLKAGEPLYVMGYPASLGAESPNRINPIYSAASKGRDGLDKNGLILISGGVQGGNSGGPVLALVDGEIQVVGIVSTMIRGGNYGCATPISTIK